MSRQSTIVHAVRLWTAAFLCAVGGTRAHGQDPAQDGQWSDVFGLPLIAIHAALLPTGEILLFSAEHGVPGIHCWLLIPDSLDLLEVAPPAGWNLDCAGHSFLPDGRLLVAGGTLQFDPLLGSKRAAIFDPYSRAWTPVADMADGRWYPTNITLPDGRIVTMSGVNGTTGGLNPDIEVWDPNGLPVWELIGQHFMPDYPYLHVMPNGLVFRSGPDQQTETFNPSTAVWVPVAATIFPARFEAPSVLLPPTLDRVMLIGGYVEPGGAPTKTTEIIDFADPTPAWSTAPHMQFPRIQHNAVLMPDGTVFVVGGRPTSGGGADSVMVPEIYDPDSGLWDQVAPHRVARRYHSTALLLPDARVLVAGGDYRPSGEIYSPAYLFRGPQPTITYAPPAIAYGTSFDFEFVGGVGPYTISLIALSSVTHSNNMGQRYVRLGEAPAGGRVSLFAPGTANLAPPGFYMMFVVDGQGVPSISRMVRVITRFGDFNQDDDVDDQDRDAFETCFTGTDVDMAPGCEPGDFDGDRDIDCDDWNRFVDAWTESGEPAPLPACSSTGAEVTGSAWSGIRVAGSNPFRGSMTLVYSLPSANFVQLTIYDITGRHVATLETGKGRGRTLHCMVRAQRERRAL